MNINLKDTLVDDTIIVQVQPVLEQVQTVTTHFDIVGNLLWDNLFAPLLFQGKRTSANCLIINSSLLFSKLI